LLLLAGLASALLAPLLYWLQLRASVLTSPWYVPLLTTVGACLCLLALLRARSVGRVLAVVLCGLLAAAEWYVLFPLFALPAYTGPAVPGGVVPEFATTLADGSPFTRESLQGPQATVLVFFRGHW
jgi:hypothetical protein